MCFELLIHFFEGAPSKYLKVDEIMQKLQQVDVSVTKLYTLINLLNKFGFYERRIVIPPLTNKQPLTAVLYKVSNYRDLFLEMEEVILKAVLQVGESLGYPVIEVQITNILKGDLPDHLPDLKQFMKLYGLSFKELTDLLLTDKAFREKIVGQQ